MSPQGRRRRTEERATLGYSRVMMIRPAGRGGFGYRFHPYPLNLEYLASYIRKDVKDILIVNKNHPYEKGDKYADLFRDFDPDLVAISPHGAAEHDTLLEAVDACCTAGVDTVLGGVHAMAIPQELLNVPGVTYVGYGEGEETLKELVTKPTHQGIAGLWYKESGFAVPPKMRPLIKDLDTIPFPARDLRRHPYDMMRHPEQRAQDQMQASRGCWGRCNFCCEPNMSNMTQRYRSPENVIKELKEIWKLHGEQPLKILWSDPNFMGKAPITDKLCDMILDLNYDISFHCMTRTDGLARHPDVATKMVKAKILSYILGVESPRKEDLMSTHKGTSFETQQKSIDTIRAAGGNPGGTMVVGLPGQTEADILEYPIYARKLNLTNLGVSIATPFPNTEFYDDMEKEGRIYDRDWTHYDEMHPVYKVDAISPTRLKELEVHVLGGFYTIERVLEDFFVANGSKRLTLRQVGLFMEDYLNFGVSAATTLHSEDAMKYYEIFVTAGCDMSVKEDSHRKGLHNFVDIDRLLRFLGHQKIQVTIQMPSGKQVSLIIKTTPKTIDYVEYIRGSIPDATISLSANLRQLAELDGNPADALNYAMGEIARARGRRGIGRVVVGALATFATQPYRFRSVHW